MLEARLATFFPEWDYLVITASNNEQASAYRSILELRKSLGFISGVKSVLVVTDPGGRRIGSGGSTIYCLLEILNRELRAQHALKAYLNPEAWEEILNRLRIIIIHAGGDSRRLPPYGPCGKIFIPVPGESGGALGTTLFDHLIRTYLGLPKPVSGNGQVAIASGDVLLDFHARDVLFAAHGITGVGALVSPHVAKNHGVYCRGEDGNVRMFLQKPCVSKQLESYAVSPQGQAVLDIGILNLDPATAVRLLKLCQVGQAHTGKRELAWSGRLAKSISDSGIDIYREICCALGCETNYRAYVDEVREAGSKVDGGTLQALYRGLKSTPFHVHVVPHIRFLHFGTLRDLIDSGRTLINSMGDPEKGMSVIINSRITGSGSIRGKNSWIEGCSIEAPLTLAGDNVVVGLDNLTSLGLPQGACLDIIEGTSRHGQQGWFMRAYSIDDVFDRRTDRGASLCGQPVLEWLSVMGASPIDVWSPDRPARERAVWSGRFFPFIRGKAEYRDWLWLLDPGKATSRQKEDWLIADRYSFEEIAVRADHQSFHARRLRIRSEMLLETVSLVFSQGGDLSAEEIAFLIRGSEKNQREKWIVAILREAIRSKEAARTHGGLEPLDLSRKLHTLGSVLLKTTSGGKGGADRGIIESLRDGLTTVEKRHLSELGLPVEGAVKLTSWARGMREAAFRHLSRAIVFRSGGIPAPPKNMLRSDEIVWGRAPARLDLGGGWTDTPPYSLERGGCVINAAVNLNGQAPIQAYARIIDRHEIRINSIDHSMRIVVKTLKELLNYRNPESQFALVKAALALSGFAPDAAGWPTGVRTLDGMLSHFGGGIEITTLAAIPSGSGLGTSSIMGAVLISVIGQIIGRQMAPRELFHAVLKLEQELSTGGGWQDQIGGVVEGVKMITAEKGLIPDPRIHFVPADLLDPVTNGGRTLLYYTGLRRLAKNILHEVVGRYLDRNRAAMETLRRLHAQPPLMAEAMAMRDAERFGELISVAWELNVELDPDHTTPIVEDLRERIMPHVLGAKLLGAGGGGFLLMACKSPKDAAAVVRMLEKRPLNEKARFFDYSISRAGMVVTVC